MTHGTTATDLTTAVSKQGHYAGAVTRLAAFVVDQSIVTTLFAMGSAIITWLVALVTSKAISWDPNSLITAGTYALWWVLYFGYPWSVSGKTAGMALLGIRVVKADGSPSATRNGVLRAMALPLSFLTLGIGFIPIVTGRHRRALHDKIAGTAVVYSWDARGARWRFLARQQEVEAPAP